MVIYFKSGTPPVNPANNTDECNHCVPTEITVGHLDLVFDSERDAHTAWNLASNKILQNLGKSAWSHLWENFRCTNEKCLNKFSCANQPSYIECGAEEIQAVTGPFTVKDWVIYVRIAREIKCVEQEGKAPPPEDVVPEFPNIEELSLLGNVAIQNDFMKEV